MLSTPQQAITALHYVKHQLSTSSDPAVSSLLDDASFVGRLDYHFVTIYGIFTELYGYRVDCLDHIVSLVQDLAESWRDRPSDMRAIDEARLADPEWFLNNHMLGGVCYVDLYAGNLDGIIDRIPYFKELGLTYLHLMPLFKAPQPKNDGGYAVSSYRDVDPKVGNFEGFKKVAKALREAGISLVIDFVFNHTSNEHEWAQRAVKGETEYEGYYWIFPDRNVPNAFEQTTREIFPDDHRGSFIQLDDGRWIWSTFYHFQWDLNYSNPAVFRAMARELLFLANSGVEILRMDAVAFIWKQMGTTCESLPEAHKLLRGFNAVCRIAAPSLLFKSEAIVHPDFVVQYIDQMECQLSYNPLQMALIWEGLACRDASMLAQALERRHNIANGCAWVNYMRSHDDIGWTFADEDALELGKEGHSHRRFLNSFFVNRHSGSFARGVPFQDNPKTGDCRISGTTASLAGLESGEDGAVERILLGHSIIMSTGGIPLIYLGDEVGQMNDYSYMHDPARWDDSRWVNRPPYPSYAYSDRDNASTPAGRIYAGFKHLIALRKKTDALKGGRLVGFRTHNEQVLGYQRMGPEYTVVCLANFGDEPQWVGREVFQFRHAWDLVEEKEIDLAEGIHLRSHQFAWLVRK